MAPKQKPGKSFQNYGTPKEFLEAIFDNFWIQGFALDLAASADNAICPAFISEAEDSLVQPWAERLKEPGAWGWLNPPYGRIAPWARKAAMEAAMGAHLMVLVPASTGSNWWRDYVHNQCLVKLLNGRLTFVGQKDPYPKDCALLLYGPHVKPGYEVWSWMRKGSNE